MIPLVLTGEFLKICKETFLSGHYVLPYRSHKQPWLITGIKTKMPVWKLMDTVILSSDIHWILLLHLETSWDFGSIYFLNGNTWTLAFLNENIWSSRKLMLLRSASCPLYNYWPLSLLNLSPTDKIETVLLKDITRAHTYTRGVRCHDKQWLHDRGEESARRDGTPGTVCEEMYLHEKPYTEAKILYLQTEASRKDI